MTIFTPRQREQVLRPQTSWVELQVTTNFSFLRGASHPEEFVEEAARLGYRGVAITDLHSLSGIVRAHVAAKEHRIPLFVGTQVGCYTSLPPASPEGEEIRTEVQPPPMSAHSLDVCLASPSSYLPPALTLFLYPTNRRAYGEVCTLLTQGKLRAPKGECFLLLEELCERSRDVFATAHLRSFAEHDAPELHRSLSQLKESFGPRLSLALSHTYGPDHHRRKTVITDLAHRYNIPLLATNDCYYHSSARKPLQDVVTCIRLGCTIEEAGFSLFANSERYLKPPAELTRLFSSTPEALRRTLEVAEALQFSLDELRYEYPHEVCPENRTPEEQLRILTEEGLKERYPIRRFPAGVPEKVRAQVEHELRLIHELHYERYFLTVYDIVRFARGRSILCQGRGAAANSAVCYALGITAVDPDRINLLFERFISKERNEPPDIDIDFEHERREEVLQYVYERYGRHRAALVCEVISYRTRSAVRDVGKVFSLSLDTVETLLKLLRRAEKRAISEEEFRAAGIDPTDTGVKNTIALSSTLLGFPRHLSQHVGGMIISEEPLSTFVPIENAAMNHRTVIEWDKDDIEQMGMLKIDLLSLGMLTCIRKAFSLINERLPEKLSDEVLMLHSIPPEDPTVYNMVCRADTIGVFQIESRAQMSMLPRLRPRCFYDLVIEVAIVRPGPIQGGMVHPYLRRRMGKERVTYPDTRIQKILEPTLGVPLFQEQAMELAIVGAGFTPGEADALRRALGSWRKSKSLSLFYQKIINGMVQNGYSKAFAEQCFLQIQGFGEYGFPQSHAASFALLVYVSAWLKCHHPAAFAAALLNSQPMGFYQPAQIIQDARRHGVQVLPIDAVHSQWDCTLEGDALRLGLRLIKGLSRKEAALLESATPSRATPALSPPHALEQLWRNTGVRVSTLRTLARADALSSLGLSRQQALWELKSYSDAPLPLFDSLPKRSQESGSAFLPLPSPCGEVLRDYETTSHSLRGHPLLFLRSDLEEAGAIPTSHLRSTKHGATVICAGIVLVRQRPSTAAGTVFLTIEDETGIGNLIIKPEVYAQFRDPIAESAFLLVQGTLQRAGAVIHLLVERAKSLDHTISSLTNLPGELPSLSRDFH